MEDKRRIEVINYIIMQIIIVGILLFAICNNEICYATCDDTTMLNISSGAYGIYSPYLINIHMVLGIVLNKLFILIPSVNWLTILYLAVVIWSIESCILLFEAHKEHNPYLYIIILCLYILSLNYFTFTVIAFCAYICGVISLKYAITHNASRWLKINAIAIIVMGALLRAECAKSILIVMAVYLVGNFFIKGKKEELLKTILIMILVFISMEGSTYSNLFIEKSNQMMNEALEFGETRSESLDCAPIEYSDSMDFSYEEYLAAYSAFYYDKEHISKGLFEKIKLLNVASKKYDFNLKNYFIFQKNNLINAKYASCNYIALLLACIIFLILSSENRKRTIYYCGIMFVSALAVMLVFFIIQRFVYRVVMPSVLFSIIWGMLYVKEDLNVKYMTLSLNVAGLILGFVFWIQFYSDDLHAAICYEKSNELVTQYIDKSDGTIFLAGDAGVFYIDVSRNAFKYAPSARLMGNWEIYGEAYNNYLDVCKVEDKEHLLKMAIDNDKILLLTTQGDDFPQNEQYILELAKQWYGVNCYFEKKDDIATIEYNGTGVFRWSSYYLKSVAVSNE